MDEAALHDLLSGRRTGLGASTLRGTLSVAAQIYSTVMRLRNIAYDHNWLKKQPAPVPVISLGNITTGGTGKTPMAAWLADWLTSQQLRPGLLSRGYRSLTSDDAADAAGGSDLPRRTLRDHDPADAGNDEKLVLDRLCPGVPHLQQRDRVNSARRIVKEFGCNVLILDDGFQHRRLSRDLDLLLIDAMQPWGYGHVLPRGLLREPKVGLLRADLVIITRADQCSESDRQQLKAEIAKLRGADPCVEVAFTPQRLVELTGTPRPLDDLKGKRITAFCGIGNPSGFQKTLASIGMTTDLQVYPDHHHYQPADLRHLQAIAAATSSDFVLTTLKDLVKIPVASWHGPPLCAVEIGVEFLSGREHLMDRLKWVVAAAITHQQAGTILPASSVKDVL